MTDSNVRVRAQNKALADSIRGASEGTVAAQKLRAAIREPGAAAGEMMLAAIDEQAAAGRGQLRAFAYSLGKALAAT